MNLGTKEARYSIISKLQDRGYIQVTEKIDSEGKATQFIKATNLGLSRTPDISHSPKQS